MDGFKAEAVQHTVPNQPIKHVEQAAVNGAKAHKALKEKTKDTQVNIEDLAKKLDVSTNNSSIQFKIEKENGKTIIEIKDKSSGEVIRTIPNEQALKIAQNIDDFIEINNEKGLAVDDKI